MRVFIVFRDTIYVSGLRTTLSIAAGVEAVDHAVSIALAWESEALAEADVVVLDSDLGGAMAFVQEIAVQTGARVLRRRRAVARSAPPGHAAGGGQCRRRGDLRLRRDSPADAQRLGGADPA